MEIFASVNGADYITTPSCSAEGTDGFVNWADIVVERPDAPATATPAEGAPAATDAAPPGIVEVAFNDEIEFPGPGAVLLRIPDDAGPHDNEVHFVLNGAAVVTRILYVGEPTLPLVAALQAIEGAEIFTATELPRTSGRSTSWSSTMWPCAVRGRTCFGSGRPGRRSAAPGWWPTLRHRLGSHPPAFGPGRLGAIGPARTYRVPRPPAARCSPNRTAPLVQARTTPDGRECILRSTSPPRRGRNKLASRSSSAASSAGWACIRRPLRSARVWAPLPIEGAAPSAHIFAPDGTEAWTAPTSGGDFSSPVSSGRSSRSRRSSPRRR
jgi:hypothetical protein